MPSAFLRSLFLTMLSSGFFFIASLVVLLLATLPHVVVAYPKCTNCDYPSPSYCYWSGLSCDCRYPYVSTSPPGAGQYWDGSECKKCPPGKSSYTVHHQPKTMRNATNPPHRSPPPLPPLLALPPSSHTPGFYCPGAGPNYLTINDPTQQDSKIACPTGRYSDQENAITVGSCQFCSAGRYGVDPAPEPATMSAVCLVCPKGYYCVGYVYADSSSTKKACPAGRYTNFEGADGNNAGYTKEPPCPACPRGTYSNVEAAITCATCAEGKSTDLDGSLVPNDCVLCSKGKYGKSTTYGSGIASVITGEGDGGVSARVCTQCRQGFYADEAGLSNCKSCPAGHTTRDAVWKWTLNADPPHEYRYVPEVPLPDSESSCVACQAGTFLSSEVSKDSCTPCQPGSVSQEASSSVSDCSACPANSYSDLLQIPTDCIMSDGGASSLSPSHYWPCEGLQTLVWYNLQYSSSYGGNGYRWPASPVCQVELCSMQYYTNTLQTTMAVWVNENDPLTVLGQDNYSFSSIVFSVTHTGPCTPCPPGRYSLPGSTTGQCLACRPGRYGEVRLEPYGYQVAGATTVKGRPGTIVGASHNGLPIFEDDYNKGEVTPSRPYNPYANMDGSSFFDCTTCPSGSFSLGGQRACTACSAGTYSPTMGNVVEDDCIPCPDGHSSFAGSSTCSICPSGTFAMSGDAVCSPCPNDTFSAPGSSCCRECA